MNALTCSQCGCDSCAARLAEQARRHEQGLRHMRDEIARWRQAKDFTPADARAELAALRVACDRLTGENARLTGLLVYGKKIAEERGFQSALAAAAGATADAEAVDA